MDMLDMSSGSGSDQRKDSLIDEIVEKEKEEEDDDDEPSFECINCSG
jgi:hypothetical protein